MGTAGPEGAMRPGDGWEGPSLAGAPQSSWEGAGGWEDTSGGATMVWGKSNMPLMTYGPGPQAKLPPPTPICWGTRVR